MADPLGLFSAIPVTEEIRATAPELSVPLATDPPPLPGQTRYRYLQRRRYRLSKNVKTASTRR